MHIVDPYNTPGTYRKAQLHCHTKRSDGRYEPLDLVKRYRDAGYSYVCLTDHDVVTRCDEINDGSFLALPGIEETITWGVAPLGRHLVRLLTADRLGRGSARDRVERTLAAGGIPCPSHPSWTGNLWTASWPATALADLPGPFLVEIWNPHSEPAEDARRWAAAARAHGADTRIGGVAVDDCHTPSQFDRAWVMVKSEEVSAEALRRALLSGAFYSSTGVEAEFGVEGRAVVFSSGADEVRVLDSLDRVRAAQAGGSGRYEPGGDEGFVRIECRAGPMRAWSQIFWL